MGSQWARNAVGVLAGTALVALAGCESSVAPNPVDSPPPRESASDVVGQLRSVGPQKFAQAVAEPHRVTINVHIPYEGDIPGTDLSIPFDQIGARQDALPPGRTTPLAVYCRSGRMSEIALTTLSAMGYHDVVELAGGTRAWEGSGRPLVWR